MPMDPHANAPSPVSKEETSPPPRDLFTKSHTNCPFLPSFLSVQWHVIATILGVMCLVFHTDFHFSKRSKSRMEQIQIVCLYTQAVSSGC